MSHSGVISERYTARYWSKTLHTCSYLSSQLTATPSKFCQMFHVKKTEGMFSRFSTGHDCDQRTDVQKFIGGWRRNDWSRQWLFRSFIALVLHFYFIICYLPPPMRICFRRCLFVCLSVSTFAQKRPNGFAWNFQGRLAMGQWTND